LSRDQLAQIIILQVQPQGNNFDLLSEPRPLVDRLMGVPLRIAIMLLVIGGLSFGLWSLTMSGPSERYRVSHPSGYSVIRPSDWNAQIVTAPTASVQDAILLSPKSWKGLEPSMAVRRLAQGPDGDDLIENGYSKGSFAGRQAFVLQSKPKKYLNRKAVFRDGENWYEITVSLPGFEGLKIDEYWSYMQTFRITPGTAAAK